MSIHVIEHSHFPEFELQMVEKVNRGIEQATLAVERQAAFNAPFKTGFLRNSIASQSSGGKGVVYAGAEYGGYQESGTRFYPGRHYLAHALSAVAPSILHYIENG